jgi:hypothetical protein
MDRSGHVDTLDVCRAHIEFFGNGLRQLGHPA